LCISLLQSRLVELARYNTEVNARLLDQAYTDKSAARIAISIAD
jgi:hypothetical protein